MGIGSVLRKNKKKIVAVGVAVGAGVGAANSNDEEIPGSIANPGDNTISSSNNSGEILGMSPVLFYSGVALIIVILIGILSTFL